MTKLSAARYRTTSWSSYDAALRRHGRSWKQGCPAARARNETLRATRRYGRAFWKRWIDYHARSRIEAKMKCLSAGGG